MSGYDSPNEHLIFSHPVGLESLKMKAILFPEVLQAKPR